MENQSNNNQGVQPQKGNSQNGRPQTDRSRIGNDKKVAHGRYQNYDRNRQNDKNQTTERTRKPQNDREKPQTESKYPQRVRGRNFEKPIENNRTEKYLQNVSTAVNNAAGNKSSNPRPTVYNTNHGDISVRHIKTNRVETVEDIKADVERIEKDIQFEIKQIRSAKLGL